MEIVCIVECSERPKGGFGLTAATVLRPQGPSLIAAVTETFGRKRIAAEIISFRGFFHCNSIWQFTIRTLSAEMGPFGHNSLSAETAIRLMVLRPQPKDSYR